jgi:hypothetical protein
MTKFELMRAPLHRYTEIPRKAPKTAGARLKGRKGD